MELKENECRIEDSDIVRIGKKSDPSMFEAVNSCIEEEPVEESLGATTVEKGIFGGGADGGGKPTTWRNIFFNQLEIDAYSCFYVANYTALANTFNIQVPYSVIKEGWDDLCANGCFTPNLGGKMTDGAFYAVKHFNKFTGKNVQDVVVPFNEKNRVAALKNGSDYVFGVRYGSGFSKNEQDDGIIQDSPGTSGKNGHLVCGIKENNLVDDLGKYAEQYHGVVKYDIIRVDFNKYPELFMNNMVYFRE